MPAEQNFTILYGSQTGQAKAIAEEIHDRSAEIGLIASIFCLSLVDKKFSIQEERSVVFVVSTTGDGEPPDTVRKFYRRIHKKTLPSNYLENLRFAFLALGDSNYTNFCNCGKTIEKRLLQLGAKPFYLTGCADDAVGLEVTVEPWIDGLWEAIRGLVDFNVKESGLLNDLCDTDTKSNIYSQSSNMADSSTCDNVEKISFKSQENYPDTEDKKDNDVEKESSERSQCNNSLDVNKWSSPSAELSGKALKIPHCPHPYLEFKYVKEDKMENLDNYPLHNNAPFPSAVSDVKFVQVIKAEQLTKEGAVKTALELIIDIRSLGVEYEPGDSFGIICPNDEETVNSLFRRLNIEQFADIPFFLRISQKTEKKNATLPDYIPQKSTLRHIFTTCIDIKAVPKKTLLRALVDYTDNEIEKRRLQELCSAQGAKDYFKFVREPYTGLLDILNAFPSCNPPTERLLELLPRLQPRAYSVSSSPLRNKHIASFIFNITVIKGLKEVTEDRNGLCTGWLDRLTSSIRCKKCNQCDGCASVEFEDLGKEVAKLNLTSETIKIPVYWRQGTNFRLPSDESVPVIMVGPGTGVAPFISFLSHREMQKKSNSAKEFGDMYLFFGCRHKEKDFLYRDKIESFLEKGILTKLFASFSRDDCEGKTFPRYVQDNLQLQSDLILSLIFDKGAVVYICGDAKNMAKNVYETFVELLKSKKGMTSQEAMAYVKSLRDEQRYLEDIWT